MFEVIKLMPVVILAGLMIGGFDALIAAPIATVAAALAAVITEKRKAPFFSESGFSLSPFQ